MLPALATLSASDSAWLRMDRPENQMMITGALILKQRVSFEQIRVQLAERLASYRQFRQRVAQPTFSWSRPRWVVDPDFSVERHVEEVELAGEGDKSALEGFVSQLLEQALPRDRPLWRMYYVTNYEGGAALVARVHHCLGDGMALLHVLLNLSDRLPDMLAPTAAAPWTKSADGGSLLARAARRVWAVCRSIALLFAFLASPSDPQTPLRGPLRGEKRAVWSEPIDLLEIKRIGRGTGATVNDVLLSLVAGALRRYLEATGTACDGLTLRAAVPVNLRGAEDIRALGNRFGLVFLGLPLGAAHPRARLASTRASMERIKRSPEAYVWFAILRALGRVTPFVEHLAVEFLSRKATLVVTNVVGPSAPLSFSQSDIADIMFWVPSTGRVGVGLSILSYRGKVALGLATDAARVDAPEKILSAFFSELAELSALASTPPPA